MIDGATLQRARIVAGAVAIRLRLGAQLERRSLPDLLGALTAPLCHPARAPSPLPLPLIERALNAAERITARLRLAPDTCLYRALARYAVLANAGHPARFLMGIKPPASAEIVGHAWVELHGAPAFEALEPGLVVTFAYPARAKAP